MQFRVQNEVVAFGSQEDCGLFAEQDEREDVAVLLPDSKLAIYIRVRFQVSGALPYLPATFEKELVWVGPVADRAAN